MDIRPEFNFKVIGENLRSLRRRKGLSVDEVREYMCLGSVQAVYKWERGDSLPQADSLLALMQLYGVGRIDDILRESDELSYYFALY